MMKSLVHIVVSAFKQKNSVGFFIRWTTYFFLILTALMSFMLLKLISIQSNPFFYATF